MPVGGLGAVMGFPDSSVGKESACNAGDPGLIPGLGRSAGEGIGYPLQYSWASLVAQLVKNPPANAGELGLIPGLGRSPGEGKGYPLKYSWSGGFHGLYSAWGCKELDTTEWLFTHSQWANRWREEGRRDLYEGGRAMLSPRGQEDTDLPPHPWESGNSGVGWWVHGWENQTPKETGRERSAPPTSQGRISHHGTEVSEGAIGVGVGGANETGWRWVCGERGHTAPTRGSPLCTTGVLISNALLGGLWNKCCKHSWHFF